MKLFFATFLFLVILTSLSPLVCMASILYESYNTGDNKSELLFEDYWYGQTFTTEETHKISSIKIKAYKDVIPTPNDLIVRIKATQNGLPIGPVLTSGQIDANSFSNTPTWYEIPLTEYTLNADTQYAILLGCPEGGVGSWVYLRGKTSSDYLGGTEIFSDNGGNNWEIFSTRDLMFEVRAKASESGSVGCTVKLSICGNGEKETGEDCDNNDLSGQTCQSRGFSSGALKCDIDCTFDTSQCSSGGGGGMSGGQLNLPAKISPLIPEAQIMDVNKDSKIDILDFNVLMINWGASGTNVADFNGDSIVDIFDFNSLMIYWTI